MSTHDCIQEEVIGKLKSFMEDFKLMKSQMTGVIVVMVVQIIALATTWGSLNNTVSRNNEYIWGELTKSTKENTRNLDRLMTKLEDIRFIAIKGEQGMQGIQGFTGPTGATGATGYVKDK